MENIGFKLGIAAIILIAIISLVWTMMFTADCNARGGETLRNVWNMPVCVGAER